MTIDIALTPAARPAPGLDSFDMALSTCISVQRCAAEAFSGPSRRLSTYTHTMLAAHRPPRIRLARAAERLRLAGPALGSASGPACSCAYGLSGFSSVMFAPVSFIATAYP